MTNNKLKLSIFVPLSGGLIGDNPEIYLTFDGAKAAFERYTGVNYDKYERIWRTRGRVPKDWHEDYDGTTICEVELKVPGLSDDKCHCKRSHYTHQESGFCDMCLGWCI